jgi:DNA-binding response OmpR family regulator
VTVQSEVGKGTAIEIGLPRYYGDLDVDLPIAEGAEQDERVGSDEVVLVVEDEAVVRLLVVEVLKELGYHALEAENGTSAMRILQSNQRIDLLIADLGLPDINGRALADTALETRNGLKVLFMTGYAERAASSSFLQKGMQIIAKPFSMDMLTARIRSIIEES